MAREKFTRVLGELIQFQLAKQRCMQGMFYALKSY